MGNSDKQEHSHPRVPSVYKKWNFLSLVIAIANLIVYLQMDSAGVFENTPTNDALLNWGAVLGERALNGETWRFFDCLFIHVGLRHFLGNMCALFLAAPFLISALGTLPTALIYIATGCIGNIAAAVTDPTAVVVGASGAIFGVYGALISAFLAGKFGSHSHLDRRELKKAIGISLPLSLMTSSLPGISVTANIGGMLSGLLLGVALTRSTFTARYSWATVSVATSFIAVFIVTLMTQGTDALFFQQLARAIQITPTLPERDPATAAATAPLLSPPIPSTTPPTL